MGQKYCKSAETQSKTPDKVGRCVPHEGVGDNGAFLRVGNRGGSLPKGTEQNRSPGTGKFLGKSRKAAGFSGETSSGMCLLRAGRTVAGRRAVFCRNRRTETHGFCWNRRYLYLLISFVNKNRRKRFAVARSIKYKLYFCKVNL